MRRRFNSGSSVPRGVGVYVSKPSFSLVFTVLFGMAAFLVPHRSLGEKPNVSRQQPLYIGMLVGLRIVLGEHYSRQRRRYSQKKKASSAFREGGSCARDRIRTCDLLIRSQLL
jgi:hypothetical protein